MFVLVIDGACLWMSERFGEGSRSAHYVTSVWKCVFALRFLSLTFLQFHWDSVINITARTDQGRKQRDSVRRVRVHPHPVVSTLVGLNK